ncbi:YceI family protein [soil metagenome]
MKKIFTLAFAITSTVLMSFKTIAPHTDVYKVDLSTSSLEWYAEKVTGKHNGTIKLLSGEISNTHGNYTGTFEIDMNSIVDLDLESPEYKAKLEKHLKSEDFFDAVKYPHSKFVMTSVTPLAAAKEGFTHSVKGMLTIKDKTNEISFDTAIKMEGEKIFATGSAVIDRSKFDIKYGSKTFFADIGDKMIYDDFTLKFNVVASK